MTSFTAKYSNPGDDYISICISCREDASTLLTTYTDDELSQFPSLAVIKGSWRLTMKKLLGAINGLNGRDTTIMRITKFWTPIGPPAFHIIYRVRCPLNEKKGMKLPPGSLRWYSVDQITQMSLTCQLASPEILEYVMCNLQPRNFYPLTTDPEANKEGFDILYESSEKHLVDTEASFLTPQEQLLKLAQFNKQEQKKLYKEFLARTCPHLFMNRVQFEKLMADLGWKKEEWPGLFTCADISCRGGMTFRELLVFLASTEPDTPHGAGTGEIRCQYIFRYFDKNKDNVLDQNELRSLILAISSIKGSVKQSELDKLVENYVTEIGLGQKRRLSMGTFIKKVGELKFRGTSTIFRSKISILKLVPQSPTTTERTSTSTSLNQTISTPKRSVFPGGFPWRGVSTFMSPMDNMSDIIKSSINTGKKFELATHAVKLSRTGLLEDVRPVDRVAYGKSMSLGNQEHFIRLPSVQYYDEKNPANELLKALDFFRGELPKTKDYAYKPAYSWGKFDMNHLAALLLNVADKCAKMVEKEPRLLQISSPAYILGDLHGNFPDLIVFEQLFWSLGLSLSPSTVLFLGDYVDRGAFGVEIVAYLFAQKVKNPGKIYLLRGNHEIRGIQKAFTFYLECQRKFGDDRFHEVWNSINKVFDAMSLAAVVDGKLFCCHGGIPSPWLCARMEVIDSIPNPLSAPEEQSVLAWELMWNDPVKSEQMTAALAQEMEANEGFAGNVARKTGRVFSKEALELFLLKNDLSHVIRAHEVKTAGFQVQQGGKLLTVFSSSGYCGGPNEAACIFVCQEKIRIFRINTV